MKPNLIIVKIDESEFLSDDFLAKSKGVNCYYLIDLSKIYHACSFTGDYDARFLYQRVKDTTSFMNSEGDYSDELTEFENSGEDTMFSENSTFEIVHEIKDFTENELYDYENDYEDFIESKVDYYKGSPIE